MKLTQELLRIKEGVMDSIHDFQNMPDTKNADLADYQKAYGKYTPESGRIIHSVRTGTKTNKIHVLHGPRSGPTWDWKISTHEDGELKESVGLSDDQKRDLLAAFKQWSGGLSPDKVEKEKIQTFMDTSMSNDIPGPAARAYLHSFASVEEAEAETWSWSGYEEVKNRSGDGPETEDRYRTGVVKAKDAADAELQVAKRYPRVNNVRVKKGNVDLDEAAKWRNDDLEGKTWRSKDWDDGELSPDKIQIDKNGNDIHDTGDELNARPGMWRSKAEMAKRMTKKGVPTKSELGFQHNLKMRIRAQDGLTGPKGALPEDEQAAHPTKPGYVYDSEISDNITAGFTNDDGEQTYIKRAALPKDHSASKPTVEEDTKAKETALMHIIAVAKKDMDATDDEDKQESLRKKIKNAEEKLKEFRAGKEMTEDTGAFKKKEGDKLFRVTTKRYKTFVDVYARDEMQALDRVAANDGGHAFTGPVGKDVTIEVLQEATAVGDYVIYSVLGRGYYKQSKIIGHLGNGMLKLQNGDTIEAKAVVSNNRDDWEHYKDAEQKVRESAVSDFAAKVMGKAPKNAYKVGDEVEYNMSPSQAGGSGKGKITKVLSDGEHYLINGKPVNHFEIKPIKEAEKSFYEKGYADAKASKPKKDKELTGHDKYNYKSGYEDGLTDRKKQIAESLGFIRGLQESENLRKVADEHSEDPGEDRATAEQCDIGDVVEITGKVNFQGETGEITRFGKDKKFVVVKLHDGGEHSFHSSDVSASNTDFEGDKQEDPKKFYVAFYNKDEERSWLGIVSREAGGKWHEKKHVGRPDGKWGKDHDKFLTPDDIMSEIKQHYPRNVDVEGPFFKDTEARDYIDQHWGALSEAKTSELDNPKIEKGKKALEKAGFPAEIVYLERGKKDGSSKFNYVVRKSMSADEAHKVLDPIFPDGFGLLGGANRTTIKIVLARRNAMSEEFNDGHGPVNPAWPKNEFHDRVRWEVTNTETGRAIVIDALDAAMAVDAARGREFRKPKEQQLFNISNDKIKCELVRVKEECGPDGMSLGMKQPEAIPAYTSNFKKKLLAPRGKKKDEVKEGRAVSAKFATGRSLGMKNAAKGPIPQSDDDTCPYAKGTEEYRGYWDGVKEYARANPKKDMNEGMMKTLKRLSTGWGQNGMPITGDANSPKDVVARTKGYSDEDLKKVDGDDTPTKGSPRDLQKKIIAREKLKRGIKEEETFTDFDDWKAAVLNSYPSKAKNIKFKGRMEGGKTTISAEIPGEDRCYGVWDQEEDKGHVLSEGRWGYNPLDYERDEQRAMDNDKRSFKRNELDFELRHETNDAPRKWGSKSGGPKYGIEIDGKLWKKAGEPVSFNSKETAERASKGGFLARKQTKVVPL